MSAPVLPQLPALVVGRVAHARRIPEPYAFSHRAYHWLVDCDRLPEVAWWLRPLAGLRAADHLDGGACGNGIRGDLARFLATHGTKLNSDDRLVMLANARVLGHVFDPLTVFWVLSASGDLRAVVMEVHNTYGQRHCYLLHPDESGLATTEKAFYVSPFNDVSGRYRIRLRLDPERVSVTVGLDREGARVLTATSDGAVEPATSTALLRLALSHLLMSWRVSALIRFHGIRLWLRRLPVHPRPGASAPSAPADRKESIG